MQALETAEPPRLPDERVAVCGDWHGSIGWLRTLAPAISVLAPDITTILQLGDWWMDPVRSDAVFLDAGIRRVCVTLGNHEPWNTISPLLDGRPGGAVRVSEVTWILPRPARLEIGGRKILSLGGASSVDRRWRSEGREWWPDESITDEHVAAATVGGAVDIMLTHESPARSPVGMVQEALRTNPMGFPEDALIESAASRARVSQVWDVVRPSLLMHGHMHAPGDGITDDGRRVVSLGCDGQQGNLAFLDLRTLTLEIPTLRQVLEAARHA